MPKGKYSRQQKQSLLPVTAFTTLAWWKKLTGAEQTQVVNESQQLAQALIVNGQSRIAIGEHLVKLQEILTPHGVFTRFLRNFHFSVRSANRYIASYKNAKAGLPEGVLKVALARGINVMGESEEKPYGQYTEVVKQLPPPQNPTETQATAWLDAIENARKQQRSAVATEASGGELLGVVVPQDPATLLKECFRFFMVRYNRLPTNANTRKKFVRTFIGLALTVAQEQPATFNPVAIPEGYVVSRGRPRQAAAAA